MIKNVHLKALILGAALCFTPINCSAFTTDSGPVFFMGEDIIHPQGMVLSVNDISSQSYSGGLGTSGQKQDLLLNLTLMNTSANDIEVRLYEDFALDLGPHHYLPIKDSNGGYSADSINVAAGTQSRINLTFRVDIKEKSAPELLFNVLNSSLRVVCDPELGKIVAGGSVTSFEPEDVAKTAKLLMDAGRLTAAKNLCESMLIRNPVESRFLLLMARIYSKVEDDEQTAYYLKKIDVTKMNGPEEAEEAALMAISIGYNEEALNILASFDAAGLLNPSQKALKARAYYYVGMYDNAEETFLKLFENGFSDTKAYFALGNVYNKKHDNEKAIYYWEKALELDPEYSEALFNIGVGYFNDGDISKARDYWTRVLASSPDSNTLAAAEEALKGTEY